MKTKFLIISFLLVSIVGFSQSDSGSLIQGGLEDGEKLLEAYLTPINKAIVFGMSNVSHTKFRTEDDTKKLSFGLKFALVSIPTNELTYDVSKLDLQSIEAKDPNKSIAQTVFGDSLKTVTLVSKKKDLFNRPLFEFESPTGSQVGALPLPSLDVTYRLKSTNVSLNLVPYVKIPTSDLHVGMLGASIQQNLAGFIKSLEGKAFGMSLQASSAYLIGRSDLHVKPDGVYVPVTLSGSTAGPYDDQKLKIDYLSVQLGAFMDYTIAKKYTLFAGGSYNIGSSTIDILGRYPIYKEDPSHTGAVVGTDIDDPVSISQSFNRTKFEVGARADWRKLYLQLNYNIADYGGVGLNIGYKL